MLLLCLGISLHEGKRMVIPGVLEFFGQPTLSDLLIRDDAYQSECIPIDGPEKLHFRRMAKRIKNIGTARSVRDYRLPMLQLYALALCAHPADLVDEPASDRSMVLRTKAHRIAEVLQPLSMVDVVDTMPWKGLPLLLSPLLYDLSRLQNLDLKGPTLKCSRFERFRKKGCDSCRSGPDMANDREEELVRGLALDDGRRTLSAGLGQNRRYRWLAHLPGFYLLKRARSAEISCKLGRPSVKDSPPHDRRNLASGSGRRTYSL